MSSPVEGSDPLFDAQHAHAEVGESNWMMNALKVVGVVVGGYFFYRGLEKGHVDRSFKTEKEGSISELSVKFSDLTEKIHRLERKKARGAPYEKIAQKVSTLFFSLCTLEKNLVLLEKAIRSERRSHPSEASELLETLDGLKHHPQRARKKLNLLQKPPRTAGTSSSSSNTLSRTEGANSSDSSPRSTSTSSSGSSMPSVIARGASTAPSQTGSIRPDSMLQKSTSSEIFEDPVTENELLIQEGLSEAGPRYDEFVAAFLGVGPHLSQYGSKGAQPSLDQLYDRLTHHFTGSDRFADPTYRPDLREAFKEIFRFQLIHGGSLDSNPADRFIENFSPILGFFTNEHIFPQDPERPLTYLEIYQRLASLFDYKYAERGSDLKYSEEGFHLFLDYFSRSKSQNFVRERCGQAPDPSHEITLNYHLLDAYATILYLARPNRHFNIPPSIQALKAALLEQLPSK